MAGLLTAATLAMLRGHVVGDLLAQRATVQRQGDEDDGMGGTRNVYATVPGMECVPCSVVDPSRSREQVTGDEIQSQADGDIEFPVGTNITDVDRIIVDGVIYEVIGTDAARGLATKLTAYVVRR